ncbi:MAG: hypothetical protein HC936_02090 [Leptolyngbyaceae cyanobacterium SU_3_3]|nr:hypothetical protein [Leptolyngbyaceae cyanobacterium SU_3_3]
MALWQVNEPIALLKVIDHEALLDQPPENEPLHFTDKGNETLSTVLLNPHQPLDNEPLHFTGKGNETLSTFLLNQTVITFLVSSQQPH